jgi:RHS repeat-associated protein
VYHDNGSLKDDGTYTYKYDAHDHLVEVRLKSNGSLVAEYFYDAVGRGRRIKKVVGNDTTRFVYHNVHCVEEYDGSGDLLRLFAFGDDIDQVVMMEAPDVADVNDNQNTSEVLRFHYHTQLVGSVTHVTGPGEGVVESYEYDPYGKTTIKDQGGSAVSASPIGNPFMYTGRRLDEETALYYYRARHYSPELKRFIQRDPLEYVDGPNAFAYVSGNPAILVDPLGEHEEGPSGCRPPTRPADGCTICYGPWRIGAMTVCEGHHKGPNAATDPTKVPPHITRRAWEEIVAELEKQIQELTQRRRALQSECIRKLGECAAAWGRAAQESDRLRRASEQMSAQKLEREARRLNRDILDLERQIEDLEKQKAEYERRIKESRDEESRHGE